VGYSEQTAAALHRLYDAAEECRECVLHKEAISLVRPCAAPSEVMLVGRNPGREESVVGEPYAGPTGDYIREWLSICGLKWEDVFMTHLVKCFTDANREPEPACVQKCSRLFFNNEVELVSPTAILMMGDYVCRRLTGRQIRVAGPFTYTRHKFFSQLVGHDCYVFYCYSPGVCIRGSIEWEDRCRAGFVDVAVGLKKVL